MRILKWNHNKIMKISMLRQMKLQILMKFKWNKRKDLKNKKIIETIIDIARKVILATKLIKDRFIHKIFREALHLFFLTNFYSMSFIRSLKIMKNVLPHQIIFSKI